MDIVVRNGEGWRWIVANLPNRTSISRARGWPIGARESPGEGRAGAAWRSSLASSAPWSTGADDPAGGSVDVASCSNWRAIRANRR